MSKSADSKMEDVEQEPVIVSEFTATYRLTQEELAELPEKPSEAESAHESRGRGSVRPVLRFTQVGQNWSHTHSFVRKIHYSKGSSAGTVKLIVRRNSIRGEIIHQATIVQGQDTMVRDWGTVYVEFRALEVPAAGEAAIYVHVEWFILNYL